jgi:glutathione synthase/RimK-type ligase-like ATP-grasp enzyme
MPMIYFRSGLAGWGTTRASIEEAGFTIYQGQEVEERDIILNWGGLSALPNCRIWNPPSSVTNCSDKIRCLDILEDLSPQSWTEYSTEIPTPFVMKKNHTYKGFGKIRVRRHGPNTPHQQYDYFQEFLDIEQEYRVLAFHDGRRYIIVRVYLKDPTGEMSTRPIFHPDWQFRKQPLPEVDERIRQSCIRAIKQLDMHLVGFDVAITRDDRVVVIEANSAPGLGMSTARRIYSKLLEVQ